MSKWDKKSFIKATKDTCQPHISNIVIDLVKSAESTADLIQWGRGTGMVQRVVNVKPMIMEF